MPQKSHGIWLIQKQGWGQLLCSITITSSITVNYNYKYNYFGLGKVNYNYKYFCQLQLQFQLQYWRVTNPKKIQALLVKGVKISTEHVNIIKMKRLHLLNDCIKYIED